ncbi:serine/threonine-protein kinase [Candidatus Uabimicrobium amorphum]|uniref:Protein kinase n=1 Tax=Uabimicrobium amorphum TaxID=2596890 RepID=A0A5S9IN05_UABAM|nr:serine/threonine-protein kinase [Candidatus Uabimicrobium amorphum]BBM84859.1 protein kinase [Candidatus Uabimicrobium amorphum]
MDVHKFSRYRIVQKLGQGGMGIVYKAYDSKLQQNVALKVIENLHDENLVKRFMREVRAMTKLNHPNIIRIYEYGEKPTPFFTMELIEGVTLKQFIETSRNEWHKITEIVEHLAEALHEAHKNNIIHRDIKPSNIMLTKDLTPKLMDFGLVKDQSAEDITKLSNTGHIYGSLAYMSPEQVQGEPNTCSDIYSLGATFYHLLTKRQLFPDKFGYQMIFSILESTPPAPKQIDRNIPTALDLICSKCIEKLPEHRYQTAYELIRDLRKFRKHRHISKKSKRIPLHTWIKSTATFIYIPAFVIIIFLSYNLLQQRKQIEKLSAEKQKLFIANVKVMKHSDKIVALEKKIKDQEKLLSDHNSLAKKQQKAIDHLQESLDFTLERAVFYLRLTENYHRAERIVAQVLEENPQMARAYKAMGVIFLAQGIKTQDPQQQQELFRKANQYIATIINQNLMEKEAPKFQAAVYIDYAKSYALLKNEAVCKKYMDKGIAIVESAKNYCDRAVFYFLYLKNDIVNARHDIQKALEIAKQKPNQLNEQEFTVLQRYNDRFAQGFGLEEKELNIWFKVLIR